LNRPLIIAKDRAVAIISNAPLSRNRIRDWPVTCKDGLKHGAPDAVINKKKRSEGFKPISG
jgi:hypothetical protein